MFESGALPSLNAADRTDADLARRFSQTVRPFVASYCAGCHGGPTPAAGLVKIRRHTEKLFTEVEAPGFNANFQPKEAMRGSIASILVSPDFLYRVDLVDAVPRASAKPVNPHIATGAARRRPLSGYALASRLSYFLWSSMPDEELLSHAKAGDLSKPSALAAQVRRMLKDSRARGLATEFGGNWLDFRRFENHNAVDRGRFPVFTDELREAMFEEPVRFISGRESGRWARRPAKLYSRPSRG